MRRIAFCPTVLQDVRKCGTPEVNVVPKDYEQVAKYKYAVPRGDGSNSLSSCLQTERKERKETAPPVLTVARLTVL